MECNTATVTPVLPTDGDPSEEPTYWERRRETITRYDEDAFNAPTNYERNSGLIVGDGFSLAARLRELYERVDAQTYDPVDKLNLLLSVSSGHAKISREIRTTQEGLERIERNRDKQERDWLESQGHG